MMSHILRQLRLNITVELLLTANVSQTKAIMALLTVPITTIPIISCRHAFGRLHHLICIHTVHGHSGLTIA